MCPTSSKCQGSIKDVVCDDDTMMSIFCSDLFLDVALKLKEVMSYHSIWGSRHQNPQQKRAENDLKQ
eukprot:scaffold32099_cov50-Attheya_sp.AAC.4